MCCEPQGTGVLLLFPTEMEKVYSVLLCPRIFLSKKHMCHFKQSFDSSVHICFVFRSKLDSVKFQFVFHCRGHLE